MKTKILLILIIATLVVPCALGASYLLKQVITEGETQTVSIEGKEYTVELTTVSDDTKKAIFKVNGESSTTLTEGKSHKFSDGTVILAREILIQESGDGKDLVQYNLYAGAGTSTASASTATTTPEPETATSAQPASTPATKEAQAEQSIPEPQTTAAQETGASGEETARKEAKVDMTRTVVQKKSWWGRFVDWLKGIF